VVLHKSMNMGMNNPDVLRKFGKAEKGRWVMQNGFVQGSAKHGFAGEFVHRIYF
jgi:hypothetical protein